MLSKFRSEFAVDKKSESIALCDDVDLVPIVFVDLFPTDSIFDCQYRWPVLAVNHQAVSSKTAMLLATGCMKVPGTQNIPADANVAEVHMVGLKVSFTCFVGNCPNVDAAISIGWKSVLKFKFKIGNVFLVELKTLIRAR